MLQAQDLIHRVQAYHPTADAELIQRAYDYSYKAHHGQLRKSGDPYFIHPAAVAGIMLIRMERAAWGTRLLFSVQSGAHPLSALFASGRILLAGGLLVFPGFISDAIAVILLLLPGTWSGRRRDPLRAANDEVLEGEFRREPDDLLR